MLLRGLIDALVLSARSKKGVPMRLTEGEAAILAKLCKRAMVDRDRCWRQDLEIEVLRDGVEEVEERFQVDRQRTISLETDLGKALAAVAGLRIQTERAEAAPQRCQGERIAEATRAAKLQMESANLQD